MSMMSFKPDSFEGLSKMKVVDEEFADVKDRTF